MEDNNTALVTQPEEVKAHVAFPPDIVQLIDATKEGFCYKELIGFLPRSGQKLKDRVYANMALLGVTFTMFRLLGRGCFSFRFADFRVVTASSCKYVISVRGHPLATLPYGHLTT